MTPHEFENVGFLVENENLRNHCYCHFCQIEEGPSLKRDMSVFKHFRIFTEITIEQGLLFLKLKKVDILLSID